MVYRQPTKVSAEDLAIMALIDRQYLARPYYGSRRMAAWLATQGHVVNRKRVQRLMRLLGLVAISCSSAPEHRPEAPAAPRRSTRTCSAGLAIERANQIWCSDVTYIPMAKGFLYLVVIMDWASRAVLTWRLSNTLGADFCVEALGGVAFPLRSARDLQYRPGKSIHQRRLHRHPEAARGDDPLSDSKRRCMDDIFVERLWRSLKYEEVYLNAYAERLSGGKGRHWHLAPLLRAERQHQSLGYRTPRQIYEEGPADMWTIGVAGPAGLPPHPEQARQAGRCSPSPTYPQAPQPTKDLISMT